MNHKKLLVVVFPSVIIIILCMVIFFSFLNCDLLTFNQALFICTGIIVPIMFLIQGVLCGITDTNVYLSFLMSIVSSAYIVTIYMDISLIMMILAGIIDVVQGYLAYLVTIAIKRRCYLKWFRNLKKDKYLNT